MRYSLLLFFFSLFLSTPGVAQKPVAEQAMSLFNGRQVSVYDIFNPAVESKEFTSYVSTSYTLTLKIDQFAQLHADNPALVHIQLPSPFNIRLDLYKVEPFTQNAMIKTSDGAAITPNPDHHFYRGIIHENINSLAIVTVTKDQIQIFYADENGNKRIQQTNEGHYIAFEDEDILIPKLLDCQTSDIDMGSADESYHGPNRSMTGNCIEVYVECDYKSYQDNGSSIANTEAWVAALWNEVITLYFNESIPVIVSDVLIYNAPFPAFDTLTSTSALLNAFVTHMGNTPYNGRLAHLMSTRSLGGGIAYVNVLCHTTLMCAVSASLTTTIVGFPTYSWNVEVVTHEMGHNIGSPHTHACAWNGNNTQIDDCGNQYAANNGQSPEGAACYNASSPIIPASGTIMSYCHLISNVGINFNNGFGPLPGNLIRDKYNNAQCNTGTCQAPLCTSLTNPAPNAINVDVNNDISWAASAGANGYKLTIGTTPNGSDILNNFNVGLVTTYNPANAFPFNTTIYVRVVPYNDLGEGSCAFQSFLTEPDIAPLCTSLTSPAQGATNVTLTAVLYWSHSVGNQTGYKITIGTTPNGSNIANLVDVGNVAFYDPPGYLPHSSTIYVKITPYGTAGDVAGCTTQSFTTLVPINGDFCNLAITLSCGASITGNTTQAYPDPEAVTCGVAIEAPGIWYKFVGDGLNTVITTCTQYGYDTQINAYTGSCSGFTCVAGNDDFCNTGSRITFPTINGTTYYVLVQGWAGGVGSYTVSRTCYDGPFYCQSGARTAGQEWIKTFNFGSFTKQSTSSHYSDYTGETITVSRGAAYAVTITPQFQGSAKSEVYRIWIDLNKDGDFIDSGEPVFSGGPSTTIVSGNITIPLNASTGVTRMRVAMKRTSASASCDLFEYGEVEDYTLNIRCNLVTANTDTGNGSLRNVSACADDNESILFASTLNGQTIVLTSGPLVADGQWKWMPGNGSNITIDATGLTRVLSVPVGKTVEMQNLLLKGGTATNGSVIDNDGILILRNTNLQRPVGSSSIPLHNNGSITIQGACNIVP